jgi:hypothetical protein
MGSATSPTNQDWEKELADALHEPAPMEIEHQEEHTE